MPTLEVLDGPNKGVDYPLEREETIIGRLPYCDIVLAQRNVSRQHTRIIRSSGEFYVEDMNSTNGTFLNGKRVRERTRLRDHDVIRVYTITLLYRSTESSIPEDSDSDGTDNRQTITADDSSGGVQVGGGKTVPSIRQVGRVGVNAYEKLRTVLEINRTLGSTLDINQVLPKILDGLFTVFPQSDRGYILFPDAETGQLSIKAEKRKEDGTIIASTTLGPISHTVAGQVMSEGEAILSADGFDDERFDISDSVLDFPIRSMMCAPLIGRLQKPLGIIYVDTNDPYERFHEDDLEVLISVAATAGQAIEYAQAHQAQLRLDRRDRELIMAREVQLHFLPQSHPAVSGYRFHDFYRSALEVGGDYYGYVPLPDGRLAVTIGDVSGKGISAALIMARLCNEVRYHLVTSTPGEAVDKLNAEFIKPENESWFVTFVLCMLDPQRHELTVFNAGHAPPIRRSRDGGEIENIGVEVAGPPLGCDPAAKYESITREFHEGDSLIMFTDGITEAMNPNRDLYGKDRLYQAVEQGPAEVDGLCEWILGDVKRFTEDNPQSDDICLIGLQRV